MPISYSKWDNIDDSGDELVTQAPKPAPKPTPEQAPKPVPKPAAPDEDVSKLSVGELKRRIREYDQTLLVGLAEKCELVAALQKAMLAGPPPVRGPVASRAASGKKKITVDIVSDPN